MNKRYNPEDIKSWPENHKRCKGCNSVKKLCNFTKDSKALLSVSNYCRSCKNKGTRSWSNYTKDEIESWPTNHKKCSLCKEIKPFSEFHKTSQQLFGLSGKCKTCRRIDEKNGSIARWERSKISQIKKNIVNRSKSRAKKKNIPFNITEDDIVIPDRCPVFGVEFIYGDKDLTYSIDRIIPELGYTKDNIVIVSNKANMIKNNASPEEIIAVGNFYKRLVEDSCPIAN